MDSVRGFVVGVLAFRLLTTAANAWLLHPGQTLSESAADAAVMTAIWTALLAAWMLWDRRQDRSRSA